MIVILGANGFVGRRFANYLASQNLDIVRFSRDDFDYTDKNRLGSFLKRERPDFVINAAGYTGKPNVDACEQDKAGTLFGNTVLPLRIAEACADAGITWGHVSSGCIYQGVRGQDGAALLGFREEDEPNFSFRTGNCSFYSGTKALAEEHLKGFPHLYIWRLRVPFDEHDSPRNYLSKLMRYKRLLNVRNSLSHLDDFVAACWQTMARHLPTGIYNVTNPGSVTTEEVTTLLQTEGAGRASRGDKLAAQQMVKEFSFFESEDDFMKSSAIAPRSSCVLDTSKAESFGLPLRPVREAISDSLRRWVWERSP